MRKTSLAVAVLLWGLGFTSLASEEVYTERVSDRLVAGRLTLPGGEVVGFTVFDGEMFKIQDSDAGYRYGLSPYIVDEAAQRFSIKVFEITERGPGLESLKLLESLEATPGLKVRVSSLAGLEVAVELVEQSDDKPTAYETAFTVPVSGLLIDGKARLPNDKVVGFTVFEGGTFKVRDDDAGIFYGISPYIVDRESGRLSLKIFEITERGPGLESLRLLESIEATPGLKALAGSAAELEVEITGIRDSGQTTKEIADLTATVNDLDRLPPTGCCVTCGTTKACASCAVDLDCGSCCVGICCRY